MVSGWAIVSGRAALVAVCGTELLFVALNVRL
jgi:hypothetical protein